MSTNQQIHIIERSPQYWTATFDHPPINMIDSNTVAELDALLTRLETDPQVRAVVFHSNDPDFFLAHYDVALNRSKTPIRPVARTTGMHPWLDVLVRLSRAPVVSIASIRGRARGAGSEFILACDIRFASAEKAIMGQFEVGAGAVPGGGPMVRLPGLMGRGRALEVLLGADDFPGELAERYGYVNRAVPDAELDDFSDAFARRIAGFDKAAIRETKAFVDQDTLPPDQAFPPEMDAFFRSFGRTETQARMAALMRKGLGSRSDLEFKLGHYVGLENGKE